MTLFLGSAINTSRCSQPRDSWTGNIAHAAAEALNCLELGHVGLRELWWLVAFFSCYVNLFILHRV